MVIGQLLDPKLLKHLNQPYYIYNFISVSLYPVLRILGYLDKPSNEKLTMMYTFFAIFVKVVKARRRLRFDQSMSTSLLIVKLSTLYLLYQIDAYYHIVVYIIINALIFTFYTDPIYKGPSSVEYLNPISLDDKLSTSRKKEVDDYWLIQLYALWSPPCTYLAPIFSQLSTDYTNIHFGKIDIGRWKPLVHQFRIDDSAQTKTIPTLILFKNGKEIMRLPHRDNEHRLAFDPTIENTALTNFKPNILEITSQVVKEYFQLEQLNYDVKKQLTKSNRDKKSNNKSQEDKKNK
ncbi:hypothetical protein DFA_11644 [Cavenderia fasciculata]|uniref:Thioredoxin domain-containing protein n=1 Tax=Cavenderia fasciculata TaxID=261658 RepID=F4QDT6_CACFS|nr:uncharacterized protein DFA_11644 [Cavenderia fasciculata]EGG13883.1 hypothetical protein DFA_11644 [Cavenderia fasciculata]|eukprot:XP_004350591.1 hypothetical protein DFA_11644 [Cavenderia fasciculata]